MLGENVIIDKKEIVVEILPRLENCLSFGPITIVQVVQIHEVHWFMPDFMLILIRLHDLSIQLRTEDALTLIELIAQVEEVVLLLRILIFTVLV
jgi:hypothetical protein